MLQNISVRYDPVEDRLMLRLSLKTDAGLEEHWLQITRRVCAAWRQDLQAMVDLSAELPPRLDKAAKAVVSAAHHQVMASQVPTRTEPAPRPDESAPVAAHLVTRVVCGRRRNDGRWVLKFELRGRAPLALVLSNPTLHALVDALSRRVQVAGWSLPATASEAPAAHRPPASPLH
ncbi:MAG: hypothetical protein HY855_23695 [Burkholderiales bacterium]|nr:hypothetical protein [Burkholderiales bacterium]